MKRSIIIPVTVLALLAIFAGPAFAQENPADLGAPLTELAEGPAGLHAEAGGPLAMSTTTKKDLIDRIAEETRQKRTAVKQTVQSFLVNVIRELSEGNRLEFRDFGVFEIRERAPRMAQNPKTLERVPVPAKRTVKFKIGRLMKLALEGEIDLGDGLYGQAGTRSGMPPPGESRSQAK